MSLSYADRVMRVNHAGEHGAAAIYAGQIAVARLTAPSLLHLLRDFQGHELRHRAVFELELARRGVPRCPSYWLCAMGGLLLGLLTGLFGKAAIAATTVAVERTVLAHLQEQLIALRDDGSASSAVAAILADEKSHHDLADAQLLAGSLWLRLLGPLVAGATGSVIWVGMHT